MTEKLKQIIDREIDKLSKERQQVINAVDWVKEGEEIAKTHELGEKETDDFLLQILCVLVGITYLYPENLASRIEDEIPVTSEDATKMAEEVFRKIIIPMGKIVVENLKSNFADKSLNWKQNLGFVLSGGDYSVLLEKDDDKDTEDATADTPASILDSSHRIEDIKSKFTI